MSKSAREPIAIVGMSCRMPGAPTLPAFRRLLDSSKDAITGVPADRWDHRRLYDPSGVVQGKVNTAGAGFVDARFADHRFFGMSLREAQQSDPQQLVMLELAWQALEDAHIPHERLAGSDASVFLGASTVEATLFFSDPATMNTYSVLGLTLSLSANRISNFFDARGPSLIVETACSGSLSAVHLAMQSLRAGETHLALAGGINLMLIPQHYVALAQLGVLAPDARTRPFDKSAQGMVAGEGAAIIVLKRLADAVKDGDRIYALVHGSAMNQDGKSEGMARPIEDAKAQVVRAALQDAGVLPHQVGYVEAHATGTPRGDQIEAQSLSRVFGTERTTLVGSVKSHIGHLQAAAGIASVVKVALALHEGRVSATLHHQASDMDLDALGLQVVTKTTALPKGAYCGVSAFGIGGSNAHTILGPAPEHTAPAAKARGDCPLVLPLSARSPQALRALRDSYAARLDGDVRAICDETIAARGALDDRFVAIADSTESLKEALRDAKAPERRRRGPARVALVFAGHGPDWSRLLAAMPKDLPAFAPTLVRAEAFFRSETGQDLFLDLRRTRFAQPAICAFEIALFEMWRAAGVTPAFVIGHSVGEVAAAYAAGVLSLEDAMRLAIRRGQILDALHGQGTLFATTLDRDAASALVAAFPGAWIAAHNGPKQVVIGVEVARIKDLAAHLIDRETPFVQLAVDYPFHGAAVQALAPAIEAAASDLATRAPTLPWISSLTGERMNAAPTARYWADEAVRPVELDRAVVCAADLGADVFFELSPASALSRPIAQRLADRRVASLAMLHGVRRFDFWQGAADLWTHHAPLDWTKLLPITRAPWLELPPYPFQREEGWAMPPIDRMLHPIGRVRLEAQHTYKEAWHERALSPPTQELDAAIVATSPAPALLRVLQKLAPRTSATHAVVLVDAKSATAAEKLIAALPPLLRKKRIVIAIMNGEHRVASAGLVAFARSLRLEHKTTAFAIVLLDGARPVAEQGALIGSALVDQSAEVVWRQDGEHLYVVRLERAPGAAVVPLTCAQDRSYGITGGLGGIGLGLAEHLIQRGARHLLLISRRKLPPRAQWHKLGKGHAQRKVVDGIVALERLGATVRIASADAGNAAAMKRVFAEHVRGLHPPIAGLIHAAGVGARTDVRRITTRELSEQWRTKVDGLRHLIAHGKAADFIVCLSSIGAAIGTAREASYARANAAMDALVEEQHAAKKPVYSVRLGPVAGVGMLARAGGAERMAAIGHLALGFDDVCAALDRVLVGDAPVLAVAETDWAKLAPFIADRRYLHDLLPQTNTSFTAPKTDAEVWLARLWCRILRLDALSVDDNVFERGATSLNILRFVTEGAREGYRFSPEDIWARQTVAEQAKHAAARSKSAKKRT
ncbi:MAG: acyltransferase domain-containing protein [Deltaproteobacteria bacterium]|nr:acyltransferase domain-containing protein [Deltaproteobacteria bacterium]